MAQCRVAIRGLGRLSRIFSGLPWSPNDPISPGAFPSWISLRAVPVQRLHHPDPRHHLRPVTFGNQQQRFHRDLPFGGELAAYVTPLRLWQLMPTTNPTISIRGREKRHHSHLTWEGEFRTISGFPL
jgi:hypothetical protein